MLRSPEERTPAEIEQANLEADADWYAMVAALWLEVEHHPDDCDCVSCWEYYVLTQK